MVKNVGKRTISPKVQQKNTNKHTAVLHTVMLTAKDYDF